MLDFIQNLNWAELAGVVVAFMYFFEKLAMITPTKKDDNILAWLKNTFAFLSLNKPSNV